MNNIRAMRDKAKLTQAELSELCGWGAKQSRISNYEKGTRLPNINECRTIVAALNGAGIECSFDDVFPPAKIAS